MGKTGRLLLGAAMGIMSGGVVALMQGPKIVGMIVGGVICYITIWVTGPGERR